MSYTDLLTIAIPCYERKEFILEALESALNQTVKCKIIVVDNCSSHNYFEKICLEKRVTYYRNEKNIGLFPNINRCYELADTEYVKILDDDDILLPTYVESFLKAKELYPDIDVFYTNYVLLTSKGEKSHRDVFPNGYMGKGLKIIEYGLKYRLGFPYMTAAIKREKAKLDIDNTLSLGGYDWEWVYSNADQLSFYGDSKKLHLYRAHDKKGSPKYWQYNVLTVSYIYEVIIANKITEPKIVRQLKRKSFWELMRVKAASEKKNLINIIQSNNRYGKFLNEKLDSNYFLKIIFFIPKNFIRIIFIPLRIKKWN
jgi:glycosyltransferase involved in cell wall biosynthesis